VAQVMVTKSDVEWLIKQLDITKVEAEKMLKLNQGNLKNTVNAWLNA
jgi:hypothetical protein